MASCGNNAGKGEQEAERPNLTLKIAVVVDDNTTAEGIAAAEKEFNALSSVALSTKVEFVCFKASEYREKMDAEMTRLRNGGSLADIEDENAKAEAEGGNSSTGVSDDQYPEATDTQFDLVVIAGEEMYLEYIQKGWIISLNESMNGTYKELKTKVIDEAMATLLVDDHCYAIPAATAYGEYTYLSVNKKVLEHYGIPEKDITDLTSAYQIFHQMQLSGADGNLDYWKDVYKDSTFSAVLNDSESFVFPGVEYISHDGSFSLIGTTFEPGDNFNQWYEKNMDASMNLLENAKYRRYLEMVFDFTKNDYFGDGKAEDYIMGIVKGDYGVRNENSDEYLYVTLEMPSMQREEVFDSMLAVSSFTVNKNRSVEMLQELMTNNTGAGLLNILLYGVETENYSLEDGVVDLRVSYSYAMHPDYVIGNIAQNAYPCVDYGHKADTYSNILLQNKDLKEKMIDDTYDSFFEAFDRTEEGDWAKIDAFSKEVLDELMQSGTLDEFRANIDAKIVELSDKESTDEDVQRFLALKGSKDEFDTLLKGLFNYISSKINAAE